VPELTLSVISEFVKRILILHEGPEGRAVQVF
jgi:hypothetical protein